MNYAEPVSALREKVKEMLWQAEKLRRDARDLELRAGEIHAAAIDLDLFTDKIEKAAGEGITEATHDRG